MGLDGTGAESHFRDWLRQIRLTGCAFAAQFGGADSGLLFYDVLGDVDQLDANEVADFFDQAAEQHRVGILLGSRMKGDDDTATLLRLLSEHSRWTIVARHELARDRSEVGVQMTWETAANLSTDAMGFAPSAFMPATRRAPYLALAAWTGGHENANRKARDPHRVIIGDAPPPEGGEYVATMDRTRTWSKRLAEPEEIAREHLRRLAFRLDRRAVERSFPQLVSF